MLHSPRRKPRHAPSLRRLALVWLTRAFHPRRTRAAYRFMAAADHQRLILAWIIDLKRAGFDVTMGPGNSFMASRDTTGPMPPFPPDWRK